jgi:capsular polysaccharide biosynthesis protein
METARAAFKYRYVVITPARIPKDAAKPKVPLMIAGGIILAALVTIFVAIMMDFGGGRVIEPWQVDRQLGVPVLAEVRRR